jgi:hypothetical protein
LTFMSLFIPHKALGFIGIVIHYMTCLSFHCSRNTEALVLIFLMELDAVRKQTLFYRNEFTYSSWNGICEYSLSKALSSPDSM